MDWGRVCNGPMGDMDAGAESELLGAPLSVDGGCHYRVDGMVEPLKHAGCMEHAADG